MLRHRPSTNNAKDCLGVLWGLCGGGHLALAKQLVDGDDADDGTDKRGARDLGCDYGRRKDARWVRESGLEWPLVGANGLRDEVREIVVSMGAYDDTLLSVVCAGGHIETAKWIVEKFGLNESWELTAPFMAAVRAGKLEVAKWLCCSFGVVLAVNILGVNYPTPFSFHGNLEMIKWLVDVFPESWKWNNDEKTCSPLVFTSIMNNEEITLKERFEAFQWIKSYFSFDQDAIQNASCRYVINVEALKWLVKTHGVVLIDTDISVVWWTSVEGVDSVEWLVKHHRMSLTAGTFVGACGNIQDDLHCVKVLSQVVDLAPTSPETALVVALATGNMKIANWLESNFHVLEKNIKSSPERVNSTLVKLCRFCANHCDTRAIKWFVQHVPAHIIEEKTLTKLIVERKARFSVLEFLLGFYHFPSISSIGDRMLWSEVVVEALHTGWSPLTSLIVSHGGLTIDDVTHAIRMDLSQRYSSKAMKRLIHEYNMVETGQERLKDSSFMITKLMFANKTRCAEWFISNFHVSMEEMLLRVFPEITADIACLKLAAFTLSSPVHIEYVRRNLGLTHQHITHLIHATPDLHFPSQETQLWVNKYLITHPQQNEKNH
ncbi:hypothetical protein Pelo_16934 [Pelomyxa schiedti]|nr:hypothetical protein Pelo_16934 [Pelomyxa schiedti]